MTWHPAPQEPRRPPLPGALQSVQYQLPCEDCGGPLDCVAMQALVQGRLEWEVEYHCPACDNRWSECGHDAAPAALRSRLLGEHGQANILLADSSASAAAVMKVLRAELGLTLADARSALELLRLGRHVGTLPEMTYLAAKLEISGITATAQPVDL